MRDRVYVVTEAYGASATAEAFTEWPIALGYAQRRAANFDGCDDRAWTHDRACELYSFSATWEERGVACRVDINVWPVGIRIV